MSKNTFRKYDDHKEIDEKNTWVSFIREWTSHAAELARTKTYGGANHSEISRMLDLNDIANKVEDGEIGLEEGKDRVEGKLKEVGNEVN